MRRTATSLLLGALTGIGAVSEAADPKTAEAPPRPVIEAPTDQAPGQVILTCLQTPARPGSR